MPLILSIHVLAALVAPKLVQLFDRRALLILSLAPASTAVFALMHIPFDAENNTLDIGSITWVASIGMVFDFRMDPLSWVMCLAVGIVGSLVMLYSAAYFPQRAIHMRTFTATFTVFAGAMAGLVTSESTLGLFVFWELTTVSSFILIGHHYESAAARAAARQAILVTTGGGLAMLSGFLIFSQIPGGSFALSGLVDSARAGTLGLPTGETWSSEGVPILVVVAAGLVLFGAVTKSALAPIHFWLPSAMAAPTPVSAYLHAAAMVKAGVYLVLRLSPGFAQIPGWVEACLFLGLATLVLGGYRALRQKDLKLLLAYGTVSQLGMMIAFAGTGVPLFTAVAIVMVIAHATFKSAAFLIVGAVEHCTGTRDLRVVSGVGKRAPALAVAGAFAAISMAGVPISAGYVGKEAAIMGLLSATTSGTKANPFELVVPAEALGTLPSIYAFLALLVFVLGSAITVGYTCVWWWGSFATKKDTEVSKVERPNFLLLAPPFLLGATSFVLGFAYPVLQAATQAQIDSLPSTPWQTSEGALVTSVNHVHLSLWSGVSEALVTLVVIALGLGIFSAREKINAWQSAHVFPKTVLGAFNKSLRWLDALARRVTGLVQRGSLPFDVTTILVAFFLIIFFPLIRVPLPGTWQIRLYDSLLQVGVGVLMIIAAVITVRARRRFKAVLALSMVGYGVALMFALHGAPDLALTQVLVETVTLVVFVLVLRTLPEYFSERPHVTSVWRRGVLGALVGCGVVGIGLAAASTRFADPVSKILPKEALQFGHGMNVVNVTLVDVRAWDTVGELSVLLVTATGVASLIFIHGRNPASLLRKNHKDAPPVWFNTDPTHRVIDSVIEAHSASSPSSWLAASTSLAPHKRAVIVEVATRILFPIMMMMSVWLLIIGHNNPGGGFAGGIMGGLALVVRYLAGGRYELLEATPFHAGRLLGLGLFTAAAGGAAPLLMGGTVLQSVAINLNLGPLGTMHFTTAVILDVGVYLLVIGVVLDLLQSLGSQMDVHIEAREREKHHAEIQGLAKGLEELSRLDAQSQGSKEARS
ncbi:MAG: Na+/H+ antiporter subunit A [Actinomycetaceae bacterium]|nr:Na+/H+ antiporter subunit A [Actinomycetaceae bacterium]